MRNASVPRSLVVALVAVASVSATGCRTTPGKVLGATFLATAVTGNALLLSSDRPDGNELDGRAIAGMSLILLSTLALLAQVAVEATADEPSTSDSAGVAGGDGRAWTPTAASGASSSTATEAPPPRDRSYYDHGGAYRGRGDANGRFYDASGAYRGYITPSGSYYDAAGAYTGRAEDNGSYYDGSGAYAGRIEPSGSYYDARGAYAGRIDANGNVYDAGGAYAGRVDSDCDEACRRTTTGHILLKK